MVVLDFKRGKAKLVIQQTVRQFLFVELNYIVLHLYSLKFDRFENQTVLNQQFGLEVVDLFN